MRRIAVLLLSPVLVAGLLSGCGGGSSQDKSLPTVTGSYGDKPKVKIDKSVKPAKVIKTTVLKEGKGPKVAKGDLLVADYLGSIYASGKVFDNSYDRKAPAAFTLKSGPSGVISGWVKALAGVKTGSRVLMVLPPKDGYGAAGNPQAGIKGSDSLVFVVDLIARYGAKSATPAPTPVTGLSKDLPAVTGAWGTEPKINVAKGTTPPKKPVVTVLAKGSGPKVAKGNLLVVQYTASSWANKLLSKTWGVQGPQGVPVGAADGQPNPFDLLIGTPVGSRVLLTLPAQTGTDASKESVAVVIDVVGQNGTAKKENAS
ncbi:MAG: FKBP-type peptidyl-prolyl cis-trans isomerase [Actinomycetes bacterium]